MLERFILVGHSETDAEHSESHPTHLAETIALFKELKLSDKVPVTQFAGNRIVQNQVLGAHHHLRAETNTAPGHSTRSANDQRVGRDSLIARCTTQDEAIESSTDEDNNNSLFNLDIADMQPAAAPTLEPTSSTPGPISTAPYATPRTKTTKKHQGKGKELDMGNIINGNKENVKVLSSAVTTMAENQAKAFEKELETFQFFSIQR